MSLSEEFSEPGPEEIEPEKVIDPVQTIKIHILPLLKDLYSNCTADYREEDKPHFSDEAMKSKYRLEWFTNVFDLISLSLPQVKEPLNSVLSAYVDKAISDIRGTWQQPRSPDEVRTADQMLAKLINYIETEM